jgi:hypothetical protein
MFNSIESVSCKPFLSGAGAANTAPGPANPDMDPGAMVPGS